MALSLTQCSQPLSLPLWGDRYALGLYGKHGLLIILGLLLLELSRNFLMMYNFISASVVYIDSTMSSWAGDVWLGGVGLGQVCMHHADDEDRSRSWIGFYGIGCEHAPC